MRVPQLIKHKHESLLSSYSSWLLNLKLSLDSSTKFFPVLHCCILPTEMVCPAANSSGSQLDCHFQLCDLVLITLLWVMNIYTLTHKIISLTSAWNLVNAIQVLASIVVVIMIISIWGPFGSQIPLPLDLTSAFPSISATHCLHQKLFSSSSSQEAIPNRPLMISISQWLCQLFTSGSTPKLTLWFYDLTMIWINSYHHLNLRTFNIVQLWKNQLKYLRKN